MTYTRVKCVYCGVPRNHTKSLFCHKDARRLGIKLSVAFEPNHYFAFVRSSDYVGRGIKFLDLGLQ